MTSKHERTNVFDFLRLFAALSVLIQHSVGHLNVNFLWLQPGGSAWFNDGVPLFFVLSGMLVYYSYERHVNEGKPLKYYLANRYLRVAPAIYVYAIITTILLLAIGVISFNTMLTVKFMAWFSGHFMLAPIAYPSIFKDFGTGIVNGSLWTIPQEFSFYLVVPLIFWIERRLGFNRMFGGLVALSFLSIVLLQALNHSLGELNILTFLYIHTFFPYLIYFAMGIFWLRYWGNVKSDGYLALLSLLLYVILRYLPLYSSPIEPYARLLWILPLSYSIVWFGYNGPKILNTIVKKVGDLSFGVYIWHMVVVNLFMYYQVAETGLPPMVIHLLVMLITLALAALSWRWVERPALKLKPYSSRTRAADDAEKREHLVVANYNGS